jgi:hypothetical protein
MVEPIVQHAEGPLPLSPLSVRYRQWLIRYYVLLLKRPELSAKENKQMLSTDLASLYGCASALLLFQQLPLTST